MENIKNLAGNLVDNLKRFWKTGVLIIILISLPITAFLVTQTQVFKSRAALKSVEFTGTGVTYQNNKYYTSTLNGIKLKLPSPFVETSFSPTPIPRFSERFASAGQVGSGFSNLYYYVWDNMSRTPPNQTELAPNHHFPWMVGKGDNRGDGLSCKDRECTEAEITAIYNAEKPKIETLLNKQVNGVYINRGGVWIVGNEANWIPYIPPDLYAAQYIKYCKLIKKLDPTAKIANSGLADAFYASYNSLSYFDVFLANLPDKSNWPDIYNFHTYPSSKTQDAYDTAVGHLRSFHDYVKGKDPQKLIWITETGMGSRGASTYDALQYMNTVIPALFRDNLADRWFWFISNDWAGSGLAATALINAGTLTDTGRLYYCMASNTPSICPMVPDRSGNLINTDKQNTTVTLEAYQKVQWFEGNNAQGTFAISGSTDNDGVIQVDEWTIPTANQPSKFVTTYQNNSTFTIKSGNKFAFILRKATSGTAAFTNVSLTKVGVAQRVAIASSGITYKMAKSPTDLNNAPVQALASNPLEMDFHFTNPNLSSGDSETVFIQFINSNGQTKNHQATITYQPTTIPTPTPTIVPVLTKVSTLKPSVQETRDTKRRSDLISIQTALEKYKAKNGKYPVTGWVTSTQGLKWLPGLSSFFPSGKVPQDPINSGFFTQANKYTYSYYSTTSYGGTSGSWYMLVAALEKPTKIDLITKCITPNKTVFNYGRLYSKNVLMVCNK